LTISIINKKTLIKAYNSPFKKSQFSGEKSMVFATLTLPPIMHNPQGYANSPLNFRLTISLHTPSGLQESQE
jgi:hypothetical protein